MKNVRDFIANRAREGGIYNFSCSEDHYNLSMAIDCVVADCQGRVMEVVKIHLIDIFKTTYGKYR